MTELGRGFENRLDVDVVDLRAQAYLFIASDELLIWVCLSDKWAWHFHRFVALRQMSSKLQSQKNGGHFKRRAAIGRSNNRITTTSRRSKQVPACVSNIDYTRQRY